MDLHEFVAEVAEFHSDGAMGGLDGFFRAAEGAAFDPIQAKAEGGGFMENQRGEALRILG